MHLPTRVVAALIFVLAELLARGAAAGEGPAVDQPAGTKPVTGHSESFRPFTLTGNPLSPLLLKFGLNAEWLPAKHHAIVLSPSYQLGTLETPILDTRHRIMTLEAGYHYYSGSRGADGVYFGPSLVGSRERVDVEATTLDALTLESVRWALGGAIDFGGQVVMANGFTAGAGVGLMYLFSLDNGPGARIADAVRRDVVQPRLLCTAGYSF